MISRTFIDDVLRTNLALPANDLIAWTSGNASAIDRDAGVIVIKPSGVLYDELTVEKMVVVDLDGSIVQGDLAPSADTATHLYLYRQRPDVGAVIHTHSVYATAWAAAGEPIPAYLTSMADVFGGPVPCGDYVEIGSEAIGEEVLRVAGRSPAVLMRNHGVFCLDSSLRTALRAAVMVEEVAKTCYLARTIGNPQPLPDSELQRQHAFYTDRYGQHDSAPSAAG